jgi:hypothetical protein
MDIKTTIFGNFDFSCTNDPEFKEDSVREDIIAPLLRKTGWSANGPNKIIRSRALTHPYVMFGSQKRKINIIPDYLLEVNGKPSFVLDAKSPTAEVTFGDNVAQVYSYAIHPEVRAWNYGLCNGKILALFEITSIAPKKVYDLTKATEADLLDINQKLNPRTIGNNQILDYYLDGGTYLHSVIEMPLDTEVTFTEVLIPNLAIVSDNCYTISVICTSMAERELVFTFDFDRDLLNDLLSQLPPSTSSEISKSLKSYPFRYINSVNPPSVHITFKQSSEPIISGKGEMFFPMRVISFSRLGIDN